ncbi:MAG: hypothetical protein Q8O84_05410, partial [Nanoarchaeota archaeon]|nr:hypothetical protein [Nanoarchaeota archaeon]
MLIRKIKKLALKSYNENSLNEKVISLVSKKLNKKNLKVYINELKRINDSKIVKVYVPNREFLTDKMMKSLSKFFENKELRIIEEPDLIAGLRIIDNDLIYELNLRDS